MFKMNKNVEHNRKPYPKDSVIEENDENFAAFQSAGHVSEVKDEAEQLPEPKSEVEPVHSQGEIGVKGKSKK